MLTAFDLEKGQPAINAGAGNIVVCLCADWCGTCRTYREEFETLSVQFPDDVFIWIDVEDDSEWAGDIDIENFPTLLIANEDAVLFSGTLLPHIGHLEKLLLSLTATPASRPPPEEAFEEIAARLWHTLSGK